MNVLVPCEPEMFIPTKTINVNVKDICIIGGGPAGLACLKVFADTPEYKSGSWKPVVFEARDQVGGIWLPAPPTMNPPLTPLYDSLTTNIPHPIMGFSSFPFPPSTAVYPTAAVVQSYLEGFVSHFDLGRLIRLNTTVRQVDRDPSDSCWEVRLSTDETLQFDYVVVANGHYSLPRYPDIPGLDEWLASGKASHSAWYRRPHDMGQVVLVVGAGPSGRDIAAELHSTPISSSSVRTVLHSIPGTTPHDKSPTLKIRGRVAAFLPNGRIMFENDGGGAATGGEYVDHCVLATGYEVAFPFLPESIVKPSLPPSVPPLPQCLYNSTYHVFPLMRHLFPLQAQYPPTSIAFPGLLYRVAPLPLVEAQAHAMVKVWLHPESLDLTQEAIAVVSRYEDLKEQSGGDELRIAKVFARVESMNQFDYRDELYKFAYAGDGDRSQDEIESKKVPLWHKEIYAHKEIVRLEWVHMEQNGEAEEFVTGVGHGGPHEWEGLMLRLLARALERQGKSKL